MTQHTSIKKEIKRFCIYAIIIFSGYFIYKILKPIALICGCIFLANALYPLTKNIEKKFNIKHQAASVLSVAGLVLCILSFLFLIVPVIANQLLDSVVYIKNNSDNLYKKLVHISDNTNLPHVDLIKKLLDLDANNISQDIISFVSKSLGTVWIIIAIPIITLLLLNNWARFWIFTTKLIPKKYLKSYIDLSRHISKSVRRCVSAQLSIAATLSLIYGILFYIIGIKNAFQMGFACGGSSLIPYVGFGICAISITLGQLIHNPDKILLLLIVFIFVQSLDTLAISPRIFGKNLNIDSSVVFVVIIVITPVFGILGAVLTMPVISVIKPVFDYYISQEMIKKRFYVNRKY